MGPLQCPGVRGNPPAHESVADALEYARYAAKRWRSYRKEGRTLSSSDELREAAAANNLNMMPFILDCVRAYSTLGEICNELRGVYGVYEEPNF